MLDALVDTLAREAGPVSVIETHISAVLLTASAPTSSKSRSISAFWTSPACVSAGISAVKNCA